MSRKEFEQARIEQYLSELYQEPIRIEHLSQLGGETTGAAALKAFGYGRPVRITFRSRGDEQHLVLRRVNRNGFGRERGCDRVAEVWRDFHTFNRLPRHILARDMVAVGENGRLQSAGHIQELLLLTTYAPGHPYADDLLRIRHEGTCTTLDIERAQALATYLAHIHAVKHDDPLLWRRRLRDLVGHGEGIMGLADSYEESCGPCDAFITEGELQLIEEAANRWRWQLKPRNHRLSQVHGDFHPFNVLFTQGVEFMLIDRSRGEWGEPADDISCMAINYLFFSLQRYGKLAAPFTQLYTAFWETYFHQRKDEELAGVIAPWFAWRALVLASPRWYPSLTPKERRKLLNFARNVMSAERFDWANINNYLEAV